MKTILKYIYHLQGGHQILMVLLILLLSTVSWAQISVPFVIENNSDLPDNEVFVAIVGEDLSIPSNHIWVDPTTGNQLPMSPSYNTVQGPVYGGNQGPGLNGKYAACFKRLSEIPGNTVNVPPIQGCRIYISQGEQLYFYFFGASGDPKGYTAPNHTDPTDPNKGIRFEVIELTNNEYGMFANTTRVDAYQYPIGMELFGNDGYYKKVGEVATHEEITAAFKMSVPQEFQGCLDPETGRITAPSKTPEFADGSVGSMPDPGPYVNYMKPYIDAIWTKYANEDLIFDAGDAGVWKGRVQGEQLVMESQSPAFMGRKAVISRRPTTQEAFEGKGVLDNVVQDATTDLLVQAQICAALNRHVIDVNTPNVGLQDWSDASKYYQESPCNHYAKFWHQEGISIDRLSYGFAYDDVWEHSSSVHTPSPTKAIIHLGPYNNDTSDGVNIPATIQAENYTAMSGIQLEATSDDGGGQNVGWIDTGDWLEYEINAPEAREYTIKYRVASQSAGGTIELLVNGISKQITSFDATGDWQTWNTVQSTVSLAAGPQTIRVVAKSSGWNINWLQFEEITVSGVSVPAKIEAEAYTGMTGVQLESTSDDGGGQNVGWIDSGDWLEYEIYAPESGQYTLSYRVASLNSGGSVEFLTNGVSQGPTTFAATGGWQTWATETTTVSLTAGNQTIRLLATSSGWNINWIEFTNSGTPPSDQGCRVAVNADFSVNISDHASNPTLTFVPERSGVGSPTCILYYGTSPDGTYPGYLVSASTPYQINASAGQTIYYYYTYSLPESGENNTLNNKKSFVVGQCNNGSAARMGSEQTSVNEKDAIFANLVLFPNPANNRLTIVRLPQEVTEIRIYDATGKTRMITKPENQHNISLDISSLVNGLHFVRIQTKNGVVTRSFIKR